MFERRRRVAKIFERARAAGDWAGDALSSSFFRMWYWLKHVWRVPAREPAFLAKRRKDLARNWPPAGQEGDAELRGGRYNASWLKIGAVVAVVLISAYAVVSPRLGGRFTEELTVNTQQAMTNWLSRMRASLSDRGYSADDRKTAELARDDVAPPAARTAELTGQTADPKPTGSITETSDLGEPVPVPQRPPEGVKMTALAPAEIDLPPAKPKSAKRNQQQAIAGLSKLLKMSQEAPPLREPRTALLLALEAYMHPEASALPRAQRAKLKQRLHGGAGKSAKPRSFPTHGSTVYSAVFSPNGAHVVSASADGTARIWDVRDGTELKLLDDHSDQVFGAFYSPDGSRLITTSKDRTGRIWDTKSGSGSVVLRGHHGPVHRPSFDAVGGRVVTASADGTAIVWDAKSGRKLVTITGHDGPVWSATFSPDGRFVVTTSKDGTARIWLSVSGDPVARLEGHRSDVVSAAFSPDGSALATGSRDGSVRLWDPETGKQLSVLRAHKQTVITVVFSRDGAYLVTASFDETAKIWELATGQVLFEFQVGGQEVRSAELSPDGRSLLTVSSDGTVSIWPVTLSKADLANSVLEAAGGCLSQSERSALGISLDRPAWCGPEAGNRVGGLTAGD